MQIRVRHNSSQTLKCDTSWTFDAGCECVRTKVEEQEFEPVRRIVNDYTDRTKQVGDFSEVLGQYSSAKECMKIATAGRQHLVGRGPPGTDKTMLASRLPSILPDLNDQEVLEVTSIHSISGTLTDAELIRPPFNLRTILATGIEYYRRWKWVLPRPGAVSRAHNGVLFLDAEFSPRILQTLRQPLESGEVVTSIECEERLTILRIFN